MPGKNEEVISKDAFGMALALDAALRSKDPSSQIGAVIIDADGLILSIGYNGSVKGFDDELLPWSSLGEKTNEEKNIKNNFVVHAEINAILSYEGTKDKLKGATMYVTLSPCDNCFRNILQTGITRIVYLEKFNKLADEAQQEIIRVLDHKVILEKINIEDIKKYLKLKAEQLENVELNNSARPKMIQKKYNNK